jgi:hypothetical protein
VTLVATTAGLIVVAFAGFGPADSSATASVAAAFPPAAQVLGTTTFSPRDTVLFTARGRSAFVLVTTPSKKASVELVQIGPTGAVRRRRVPFDHPNALMDVSAGVDGVYAGTAVIKQLSNLRDELIRIDPTTLTIRARATFPAAVLTVEDGTRMWATLGDGRVLRLDPRTLTVDASRRLAPARAAATGAASLSKPGFGLGGVWVLAGNARKLELFRLDPNTLTIRSRTHVPSRGRFAQALHDISADARHVYLVGGAIAPIDRRGLGPVRLVPGLATAAVRRGGHLIGITVEPPTVVGLDGAGHVIARTHVRDAGARLAVSGDDAWFEGNVGHGNGIIHVRLR